MTNHAISSGGMGRSWPAINNIFSFDLSRRFEFLDLFILTIDLIFCDRVAWIKNVTINYKARSTERERERESKVKSQRTNGEKRIFARCCSKQSRKSNFKKQLS